MFNTKSKKTTTDVNLAKDQHGLYIETLKGLVKNVIEIPADDQYPDCVFIEDTAVFADGKALIARPGARERDGEQQAVHDVFKSLLPSSLISTITPPATLDGGDVMYTGKHIFVGTSKRTNKTAIQQLSKCFSGIQVHTIPGTPGVLHLKCVASPFDHKTLIVAQTELGHQLMEYIAQNCKNAYRFVIVPDIPASNILRIGNTIVIQDGYPKSQRILQALADEHKVKVIALQMSELIKADGSLTCGSILFQC